MDNHRNLGLTLIGLAIMGLLAGEIVAPAHASKPHPATYAVAISASETLSLMRQPAEVPASEATHSAPMPARTLVCRGVVGLGGIQFGYACRAA